MLVHMLSLLFVTTAQDTALHSREELVPDGRGGGGGERGKQGG